MRLPFCALLQLSCEDGARDSFEEVAQHCLLERSRVRSQSWEDVILECMLAQAMISRGLSSLIDPVDIGPDLWGERTSWVKPELKRHRVVSVEGHRFFFEKRQDGIGASGEDDAGWQDRIAQWRHRSFGGGKRVVCATWHVICECTVLRTQTATCW